MLTTVEASENYSWQDALGEIQLAINCTVNRVTKESPLELLIGKVDRPLSLMTYDDVELDLDLQTIRSEATRNIENVASYDKLRFDKTKASQ